MKRDLLFLFAMLTAFTTFARDFTYEYGSHALTYTVLSEEEKTVTTLNGTAAMHSGNIVEGELKIPATVYDDDNVAYTVVAIGYRGFADCGNLTSVTIPNSVISIGDGAFNSCKNLASLTIPNSVVTIGKGIVTFNTALTSIVIPESVTTLGDAAFSYCTKLNTVWLPGSLTSLGDSTFGNSSSVKSVYYNTESPITAYKNVFSVLDSYSRAVLYVPSEAAAEKCRQICPWMYFYDIQVFDFSQSAVGEINSDEDSDNLPMYDLYGRKVTEPQKGQIYIRGGKKFVEN